MRLSSSLLSLMILKKIARWVDRFRAGSTQQTPVITRGFGWNRKSHLPSRFFLLACWRRRRRDSPRCCRSATPSLCHPSATPSLCHPSAAPSLRLPTPQPTPRSAAAPTPSTASTPRSLCRPSSPAVLAFSPGEVCFKPYWHAMVQERDLRYLLH